LKLNHSRLSGNDASLGRSNTLSRSSSSPFPLGQLFIDPVAGECDVHQALLCSAQFLSALCVQFLLCTPPFHAKNSFAGCNLGAELVDLLQ